MSADPMSAHHCGCRRNLSRAAVAQTDIVEEAAEVACRALKCLTSKAATGQAIMSRTMAMVVFLIGLATPEIDQRSFGASRSGLTRN